MLRTTMSRKLPKRRKAGRNKSGVRKPATRSNGYHRGFRKAYQRGYRIGHAEAFEEGFHQAYLENGLKP